MLLNHNVSMLKEQTIGLLLNVENIMEIEDLLNKAILKEQEMSISFQASIKKNENNKIILDISHEINPYLPNNDQLVRNKFCHDLEAKHGKEIFSENFKNMREINRNGESAIVMPKEIPENEKKELIKDIILYFKIKRESKKLRQRRKYNLIKEINETSEKYKRNIFEKYIKNVLNNKKSDNEIIVERNKKLGFDDLKKEDIVFEVLIILNIGDCFL